jgi:uncharacterized protein YabE (DUF348 family)
MHTPTKNRSKIFLFIIFLIIIFFVGKYFYTNHRVFAPNLDYSKTITLQDNGIAFMVSTRAQTVSDFLVENKIALSEFDQIIPEKNSPIISGENIFIRRAVKIKIEVDGKTIENYTLASNIRNAISENNITLGKLDKTFPDLNFLPTDNLKIAITRINVEEKIIPEEINFKTIEKNDPKLSWRDKKVEQKGEKGIREVKYKITYQNGKEISRIILEKNITREPLSEIVVKGTYMELGKANKGQGTWYAWKGGLFAASTTIPKGAFVKVTNLANGKSVVVEINDYGPQGKGRIIDLDKVAFAKIASLGAGVIGVKVERILN